MAILSEAFFKWRSNLKQSKRVLSPDPSTKKPILSSKPGPRIFYPVASAHLSQSDFGILFPKVTKVVFKADNPERTLRLNTRAILEMMRETDIEVADTSRIDMEEESVKASPKMRVNGYLDNHIKDIVSKDEKLQGRQDWKILATDGSVKGWVSLDLNEEAGTNGSDDATAEDAMPSEAVLQGEVMDNDRDVQRL